MIEWDIIIERQAEEHFKQEIIWSVNTNVGEDEEYDDFNTAVTKRTYYNISQKFQEQVGKYME